MPFSSCPMSVARFAMPPHRRCMNHHKRLWAAPLHPFEANSPHLAISPASKKCRPQCNIGNAENISDLRFLILLLALYLLLLQCQKTKKESSHSDHSGQENPIVKTQNQIFNKNRFSSFFFSCSFFVRKTRCLNVQGPQLATALGGGIAPPRLRNPNSEPKSTSKNIQCPNRLEMTLL